MGAWRSTLKGNSDSVRAVVFSPDDQLLASASDDHSHAVGHADKGNGLYLKTNRRLFEFSRLHRSVGRPQSDFSLYLYVTKQ